MVVGLDSIVSTQGASASAGQNLLANLNLNSGNNFINNLANKYVVKPKNAKGIHGFVFDYEGEASLSFMSEITDHYTEENQAFQDHAAHKPLRITLEGFVGELVQAPSAGVLGAIQTFQSSLTQLPAILGKYTPGVTQTLAAAATKATDVVNQIDNAVNRVQNLIGLFGLSSPGPTKQSQAFLKLWSDWFSSVVFGVVTPYGYLDNMIIENVSIIQPKDTKDFSDFSVTLKEIRVVDQSPSDGGSTSATAAANGAGRNGVQMAGTTKKGQTAGTTVPVSSLFSSFGHVQGPSVGSL